MKILLTGAGGYTGEGVAESLMTEHWVRGFDVKPREGLNDFIVGDISDLATCRKAVDGVDGVVFCHMAPRPAGYRDPVMSLDVNVKGTANIYHAMTEGKAKRAVLISSTGVLPEDAPPPTMRAGHGPYRVVYHRDLYCLSKVFQEMLGRFYFEAHGILTSILRPSWIIYDGRFQTKYGEAVHYYNGNIIDPRDIGWACVKCLALADPTLEAFNIGPEDAPFDVKPAYERLGWKPRHRFETLDWDPAHHRPSRLAGNKKGGSP